MLSIFVLYTSLFLNRTTSVFPNNRLNFYNIKRCLCAYKNTFFYFLFFENVYVNKCKHTYTLQCYIRFTFNNKNKIHLCFENLFIRVMFSTEKNSVMLTKQLLPDWIRIKSNRFCHNNYHFLKYFYQSN